MPFPFLKPRSAELVSEAWPASVFWKGFGGIFSTVVLPAPWPVLPVVFLRKSSSSVVTSPSSDSTPNGSTGEFSPELLADSLSGGCELGRARDGTRGPCRIVLYLSDPEELGDTMRTVLVFGGGGTSAEYQQRTNDAGIAFPKGIGEAFLCLLRGSELQLFRGPSHQAHWQDFLEV